jgi:hypothetical protein
MKKSYTQVVNHVMHHHERIISIHLYSRVVFKSEVIFGDQVVEEVVPLVEVGVDICGTSPEPDYPVDQGKPRMHLNPTMWFTNFISLFAYEMLH